jgi:hypothetical protein
MSNNGGLVKRLWLILGVMLCLALGVVSYFATKPEQQRQMASSTLPEMDSRHSEIQKILDNRCVVCHSCNNAPCQMNLTSYTGLRRGATQAKVYEATRKLAAGLTRLDIDANNEEAWRSKSFFPVINDGNPAHSILAKSISQNSGQVAVVPPPAIATEQTGFSAELMEPSLAPKFLTKNNAHFKIGKTF